MAMNCAYKKLSVLTTMIAVTRSGQPPVAKPVTHPVGRRNVPEPMGKYVESWREEQIDDDHGRLIMATIEIQAKPIRYASPGKLRKVLPLYCVA